MRNIPLHTARYKAGVTIQELAKRTGFATVSISRWENGHRSPTVDQLRKIAEALDCELADLIEEVAA